MRNFMMAALLVSGLLISSTASTPHKKSQAAPPIHKISKATSKLTAAQKSAAMSALKSLRKLQTATVVGVSYADYGSRLIDAKSEVDEATKGLPTCQVKTEIAAATDAFTDAHTTWGEMIETKYYSVLKLGSTGSIFKKYAVPIDLNAPEKPDMYPVGNGQPDEVVKDDNGNALTIPNEITDVDKSLALSVIWSAASLHIKDAEAAINK